MVDDKIRAAMADAEQRRQLLDAVQILIGSWLTLDEVDELLTACLCHAGDFMTPDALFALLDTHLPADIKVLCANRWTISS